MTTLRIDVDCTKLMCGACILRPNVDSVAPQCPLFMGPDSKLIRDAGGNYLRCRACGQAERDAGPIGMAAYQPSAACWIIALASAFIAFKTGSWWSAGVALIYGFLSIQFMPPRKRDKGRQQ